MNWMYWHLVCTCNLAVYKLLTFNNTNLAIFTFLRTREVQIYRFILVYNYMNLFFHLFSYLYVTGCLIFFWLPPVSCSSLEFLSEVIFFIIFAFSLILTDNNSFEWFVAAIALQNASAFNQTTFFLSSKIASKIKFFSLQSSVLSTIFTSKSIFSRIVSQGSLYISFYFQQVVDIANTLILLASSEAMFLRNALFVRREKKFHFF